MSKLKYDLAHVVDQLDKFESALEGWQDRVSLDNKNIEVVNIEQSSWLAYYDEVKVQLKMMVEYMDYLLKQQKAKAMKAIYHNMQKSVTDRTVEKLAEDNKTYKDLFLIYLEVKELYMLSDSIVNQLYQRAYSINNIVKIREKELEGITLHLDQ